MMSPDKYYVAFMTAWTGYIACTDTWTDFIRDFSLTYE